MVSEAKGNLAGISHIVIPQNGIYTIIASQIEDAPAQEGSFTIRVSHSREQAVLTGLTTITAAAGTGNANTPMVGINLNDLAPNFEAVTNTGDKIKLSDYRGKVVILNFWATWCVPCRVEMPSFETAYTEKGGQGFAVLAVNNAETVDDVTGFGEELGLTFPLVMDETAEINQQFGIQQYPSTLVINRDGLIVARHFGPLTADEITELVEKELA
jgi:peroxiredoxin